MARWSNPFADGWRSAAYATCVDLNLRPPYGSAVPRLLDLLQLAQQPRLSRRQFYQGQIAYYTGALKVCALVKAAAK